MTQTTPWLPSFAQIIVTGSQATEYLQGQLTINLNTMSDGHMRLAAHCDFKGKAWAVFLVIKCTYEHYVLITTSASVDSSLRELRKYGVFSKVNFTDATTVVLSLDEHHGRSPTDYQLCLPGIAEASDDGFAIALNTSTTLRCRTEQEREASHMDRLLAVEFLIHAGVAQLGTGVINEMVPQMLNLQVLDAIDFDKGCYTGQEVVARTKFLGKNKRATYLLTGSFNDASDDLRNALSTVDLSGHDVELQIGDSWRRSGKVVTACANLEQLQLLAVLPNDLEHDEVFRLKARPDFILKQQPLPYQQKLTG